MDKPSPTPSGYLNTLVRITFKCNQGVYNCCNAANKAIEWKWQPAAVGQRAATAAMTQGRSVRGLGSEDRFDDVVDDVVDDMVDHVCFERLHPLLNTEPWLCVLKIVLSLVISI